jgi:hypothetical protein
MVIAVTQQLRDVIPACQARTLWGLFCERIRRSPEGIAYRDYNPSQKYLKFQHQPMCVN